VPHPFFATSPKRVPVDVSGVQELSFTTAMALRDAAAFVQQWYPAAGYRIIGGDSEEHEADIDWATANFTARRGCPVSAHVRRTGSCSPSSPVLRRRR
jgi:hypothetical protein